MGFRSVRISEIDPLDIAGVHWLPLRHTLGVRAFGTNAYRGDAGERVIEEHTEAGAGHEELYVVLQGHARFTLDGEDLDAPAGTVVFLPDPPTLRVAVAEEDGTVVLAVGAKAGEAYEASTWEACFLDATAFAARGEYAAAEAVLREGLEAHPGDGDMIYEIARVYARSGRPEEAIAQLEAAFAASPRSRGWAAEDEALASLRDRPDWPL